MCTETKCPLCGMEAEKIRKSFKCTYRVKCNTCGTFDISNDLLVYMTDAEQKKIMGNHYKCNMSDVIFKASCIAAERKLKSEDGHTYTLIAKDEIQGTSTIHILDFIKDFPKDPIEQFNRALLNLGRMTKTAPFSTIEIDEDQSRILFLSEKNEFSVMISFLVESQLIKIVMDMSVTTRSAYNIAITPYGWERISELKKHYEIDSNKAFIAMWFDKSTEAFREVVRAGIKAAGYEMIVVDETHHNDFIMDEVLNSISESKFIVADFTCEPEKDAKKGVRGGVYYEAGFAAGQNKEVIMTCRGDDDSKKRRHFDVEQKNTIFWTEKEGEIVTSDKGYDLAAFLKERIIRTVGKGSNVNEVGG